MKNLHLVAALATVVFVAACGKKEAAAPVVETPVAPVAEMPAAAPAEATATDAAAVTPAAEPAAAEQPATTEAQ